MDYPGAGRANRLEPRLDWCVDFTTPVPAAGVLDLCSQLGCVIRRLAVASLRERPGEQTPDMHL